ncbi:thiamine biosynthesis lipoprotein [Hoeflea halophila]|uniref:FAD:protein FMN transferase n=1 Tax=Hoeflea halophila TaxID=714899 RepID=A0A286IDT1_9HYPH|nr:FAD:protein FMN transferase [Hoeflea halophila]SOE18232.1 thiamine biosynthesis lipoprotein [Hoeflea halophila]
MSYNTLNRREVLKTAAAIAGVFAMPQIATSATKPMVLTGSGFGTQWRALCDASTNRTQVAKIITDAIALVDRSMSPYRCDSEIFAVNAAPKGSQFKISPEMAVVLASAETVTKASDGAFDPGVGPLVNRMGFGPIRGDFVPFREGFGLAGERLLKHVDGATIDLCGIAKGRAVDLIIERLHADGFDNMLVEIGGEYAALGSHPAGRPWHIAVENPLPGTSNAITVIRPDGRAIATSGHRHQGVDGIIGLSHIMAPAGGQPASQEVRSATVIADNAMEADAWSTALAALDAREAVDLAHANAIDALILVSARVDCSLVSAVRTGHFTRHEVQK